MGGGAAFFDMDNDGDDDIWITGGLKTDALYRNNGDGTFTNIAFTAGLGATNSIVTTGVVTGDLDNDGFRDVLVLSHRGHRLLLFKNNGDATFTEVALNTGENGVGSLIAQNFAATMGDINQDGYLDIYVGNYIKNVQLIEDATGAVVGFDHDCFHNWLFLNNGSLPNGEASWTFTEVGQTYGVNDKGCALATTFTDIDLDADADLLVVNDFGEWLLPNALYQNNMTSDSLLNVSPQTGMDVGIYGMGIAVGDYDQDEDLDYYMTNLGRNVLLENQGNQHFIDKTNETHTEDTYVDSLLATGWGTAFLDVDNDSDLDLFVANGRVPAAVFIANSEENYNRLFLNNGNDIGSGFKFSEAALEAGLADGGRARGFLYSDYDLDGDLDILVINTNRQATPDSIQQVLLFRNDTGNENNYLQVKLEGITTSRDAYGANIKIVLGEKTWVHDYNGGFGSHASQHTSVAHFGLGAAETVDSLMVTWPGGVQHHFTDISANQLMHIVEDGTITNIKSPPHSSTDRLMDVFPNPFSTELQIAFELSEPSAVEVRIFDALGRAIDTIKRDRMTTGKHTMIWHCPTTTRTTAYFFIQLKTSYQTATEKVIFRK